MAEQIQWSSLLTKLHAYQPPAIEDLQRYSTANLDPWTVQLGQVLCDRFQFAALGHRNLANCLHNLPGDQFKPHDFETGYGYYHVLHVLLRTSEGLNLAAVTGVLAEYFHEDFVVDFFTMLARLSSVPHAFRPLEAQWRRMVKVLYGVLATSTFGQVVMAAEDIPSNTGTDIDLQSLIKAMESMSASTQKKAKTVAISCGADLTFQVAIATWLFDLKYKIMEDGKVTRVSPNLIGNNEADVTFDMSNLGAALASPETDASPKYHYPVEIYVVGGRVPFDGIFKVTFGSSFTGIKNDVLATYLACAAKMMHDYLDNIGRGSEFSFLPHNMASVSGPRFGFVDTLLGWFPELHRLSPRLERLSKLSLDEATVRFRESYETLKETCKCSACNSASTTQPKYCAITVVESIVSFGLYVTRMVVQPGLYPKMNGVRKMATQIQESRTAKPKDIDPVEDFMQRIGRHLPTSVQMLKTGANLFSNSSSNEIDTQAGLMGITHAGLTIFLNGGAFKNPVNVKVADRDKNPITIWVMNGWMCVFGHEATMEVYTPRSTGWSFEKMWELFRLQRDVYQALKWQGSLLLSSILPIDKKEEAQAEAQGWIIIRQDGSKV